MALIASLLGRTSSVPVWAWHRGPGFCASDVISQPRPTRSGGCWSTSTVGRSGDRRCVGRCWRGCRRTGARGPRNRVDGCRSSDAVPHHRFRGRATVGLGCWWRGCDGSPCGGDPRRMPGGVRGAVVGSAVPDRVCCRAGSYRPSGDGVSAAVRPGGRIQGPAVERIECPGDGDRVLGGSQRRHTPWTAQYRPAAGDLVDHRDIESIDQLP